MKWTSKHYAKWNRYKMLYLEFDFTYMIYSEKASLWTKTTLVVALSEKQGGKEGGSEDWPQEGLVKIWGAWWKWTKSGLWWCWLVCDSQFSCVQLLATPWTVGHQAPLSMEILQARTLEWVARPDPGIESTSLMSPALAGRFFTTRATWEALIDTTLYLLSHRL